jgi:FlaG/FlaF family flagellin (archaellin)
MPVSHGPGLVIGSSAAWVGNDMIGAPDTGVPLTLSASANIAASGENTTVQLSAPSGKTTADFVAGRIQDDENPTDAVNITTDDYTELEWSMIATTDSVYNAVYEFRVFIEDTALDTITVTPQWTITAAGGSAVYHNLTTLGVGG